ncbi:MAG: hemolysin family protein [Treponema sp.]|nr:hemolysin family protein [Treponema sp.]
MNIPLLPLIIAAIVLILLSMIFSASESAFLSINKLRVRILRNKKDKRAMRVWKLLQNKNLLINTLLVGNNIVNIALSSILTIIGVDLFGSAGVGIATFIVTILLLIFGEISPKTIATHHPEPIAFFFSGFICFLEFLLHPLVYLFTYFSRDILKIFKITPKEKKVSYTEEEIKTFIDVGREQGVIEKTEKKLLSKAFKFSDLAAKDIMIPRKQIKAISVNATFKEILETSQKLRLSRFPVFKKDIDDIVGVIYVKDMLKFKNRLEEFSVETLMRPPLFILETKKMSGIQQMLSENRQSIAIVIDEYSGTEGILTREDLVREIFGSVTDEYTVYKNKADLQIKNTKNSEINGLSRLIDLNEQLNIKLESENCETLGGYICEKLGKIPAIGESVTADGYKFIVTKVEENRVSKVRFRLLEVSAK